MRRSIDRILVSHAGNLPRPDDLNQLLATCESERVALSKRLPSAAAEVVDRQIAYGVDVVNRRSEGQRRQYFCDDSVFLTVLWRHSDC